MRAELAKGRRSSDGASAATEPTLTEGLKSEPKRLCSSSAGPLLALAVTTPHKTEQRKRPRVSHEAVARDLEAPAALTGKEATAQQKAEEELLIAGAAVPAHVGPYTRYRTRGQQLRVAS